MTSNLNINSVKPIVELSNEQLIQKAPSIGATAPADKASNIYSFVSTVQAINLIRDAGWIPVEAKQGRVLDASRQGFQRHMVKFTRPELVDMGARRLEMNLYNSHDTGSSFILSGGIHELVCSNGLVVSSDIAEYRHRHVGFDNDKFVESAKFVASKMTKVGDVILDWEKIQLEDPECIEFAHAAHEVATENKKHVGTNAIELLNSRRFDDNPNNLWKVFNRIQENLIRGGMTSISSRGRRTRTREITNIKREKQLNQSLWAMADYIADVKQAA